MFGQLQSDTSERYILSIIDLINIVYCALSISI